MRFPANRQLPPHTRLTHAQALPDYLYLTIQRVTHQPPSIQSIFFFCFPSMSLVCPKFRSRDRGFGPVHQCFSDGRQGRERRCKKNNDLQRNFVFATQRLRARAQGVNTREGFGYIMPVVGTWATRRTGHIEAPPTDVVKQTHPI